MSQTMTTTPHATEVLHPSIPLSVEAEKMALRIERAVRRGTSDKVRELKVVISREGIHLSGRCGTFYCKQLAQTAAMTVTGKEPLLNQIEVW